MHPVEEGHHHRLEEDHPDEARPAAVVVNDVDEVGGGVTGEDDAGEEEDDADCEGDQRLPGPERGGSGVDDKGGDGLDHAHGGVEAERVEHEEEQGAPELRQRQSAQLQVDMCHFTIMSDTSPSPGR